MSDRTPQQPNLFSSELEPPELKPQTPRSDMWAALPEDMPLSERFRHSGWQRNRELIYDALRRTMQSAARIVAFDGCGYAAYVYQQADDPTKFMLGGSSCRDRLCLPCARDRSRILATNVLKTLDDQPARFLTLTLRQNAMPLKHQLDRLYKAFSKLRTRAFWKRSVKGGCAFIEIVYKPEADTWNVHVHCIVHGRWMDKRELSKLWHTITGDSYIIDIALIHNPRQVGYYVVKYAGKPCNNSFINRANELDEVVRATKGRRLCITFGDWRGIVLTTKIAEHDWISLGSFHEVALRAANGEKECVEAIQHICGEHSQAIIDRAATARPPPKQTDQTDQQSSFAWPRYDPRY